MKWDFKMVVLKVDGLNIWVVLKRGFNVVK